MAKPGPLLDLERDVLRIFGRARMKGLTLAELLAACEAEQFPLSQNEALDIVRGLARRGLLEGPRADVYSINSKGIAALA